MKPATDTEREKDMANLVILTGNLGNDPEIRYTANGTPVANFRMATNEVYNDKQGVRQEKTEWHRIVVWGKMAEACGEYLSKGRQVHIQGKLQTRSWKDKDNVTRYTTEIIAQRVEFLGGARQQSNQQQAKQHEVPEASLPSASEEAQLLLNEEAPF